MKRLVIDWPATMNSGWGNYGANLVRHASLAGWGVSAPGIDWNTLPPEWRLEGWDLVPIPENLDAVDLFIVACGNQANPPQFNRDRVKTAVAAIFFEDTFIPQSMVDGLNRYDVVVCGSDWNRDLLLAAGVEKAVTILQGADVYAQHHARFMTDGPPVWRVEDLRTDGPRRIFSGGKLEFRKGQDIVTAAFREYLKQDPDAILVTAWQNLWPKSMKGIDASGYVKGWPGMRADGSLDIVGWLEQNGIPRKNCVDVGLPPSWALQRVMAQCDVAVFPNRVEGGTNLVATEALAIGLPTIATIATGQTHLADWGAASLDITRPWGAGGYHHLACCMAGLDFQQSEGPHSPPPSWSTACSQILKLSEK